MKILTSILIICSSMMSSYAQGSSSPRVFLIGDSTMADKSGTPEENPERGWGQMLSTFFEEKVLIFNFAVNGRSTKSFIDEGRWDEVLSMLDTGDYVIIQFGHNDQKIMDPTRYTNPWTGYRRNLVKFALESQLKGAHPVILSSIVRRKFNDFGTLEDTHTAYPFVCRSVASELQVPFVDMQLITEDYVNALGVEDSKKIYLWIEPGQYDTLPDGKEDNTHLSSEGALQFARLFVNSILQQDLPLCQYVNKSTLK